MLASATALAVTIALPTRRAWMKPRFGSTETIVESDEAQRTPSLADDAQDWTLALGWSV